MATTLSLVGDDRLLKVSFGRTVREPRMSLKRVKIDDLRRKLLLENRTSETVAEYKKSPKEQRDAIKDVGHYVLGRFKDDVRKKTGLESVEGITLDLDHIPEDMDWRSAIMKAYGKYDFVCHTSHSHTPEAPKLRLVFIAIKSISLEEYEPAARALADLLDINVFDNTTFQFGRVMHLASSPKDGEFIAFHNPGKLVSADELLETYFDWQDVSEWPVRDDVNPLHLGHRKAAEDPTTKKGLVGAFCREFTVRAAIEKFIPDVYVPGATENRYSYTGGSKSNGAVVYDDKFLFSFHETDPCGGRAVNAFDMVRMHVYGKLDDKATEGTPVTRLPSFDAMSELCKGIDGIRADLIASRRPVEFEDLGDDGTMDLAVAERPIRDVVAMPDEDPLGMYDFDEIALIRQGYQPAMFFDPTPKSTEPKDQTDEPEWFIRLIKSMKTVGKEEAIDRGSLDNLVKILRHDRALKETIQFNGLTRCIVLRVNFRGFHVAHRVNGEVWNDRMTTAVKLYIEQNYGVVFSTSMLEEALPLVAMEREFHPVLELFKRPQYKWDGVERLKTFLTRICGVEQSEYASEVGSLFFRQLASRVMSPGVKADHMLILEGDQGLGKSRLSQVLSMGFFTDSMTFGMDEKQIIEMSRNGVLLAEVAELNATSRAGAEHNKHFITRTFDRARAAYGRHSETVARQFCLMGTTNGTDYLSDPTGNRRYLPVACATIDLETARAEVVQLWAEAFDQVKRGIPNYLVSSGAKEKAVVEQSARCFDDEIVEKLTRFLEIRIPAYYFDNGMHLDEGLIGGETFAIVPEDELVSRRYTTRRELWQRGLGMPGRDFTRAASQKIMSAMTQIPEWGACNGIRIGGIKTRGYIRK